MCNNSAAGGVCEERLRLQKKFDQANERYFESIAQLRSNTGKLLKPDYDRLMKTAEEAKAACEATIEALAQHADHHGCG
jgi:hypothetical protein